MNVDFCTLFVWQYRLTDKQKEIIDLKNKRKAEALGKLKRDMEIKKEIRERIKNETKVKI